MSEKNQVIPNAKDSLQLKVLEEEVSLEKPWDDDVLERAQIATKLTKIVRNESVPLTISINGYWGTGKTFLLKRWQKDLERQGFKAIYFNSWEDDFL